MKGGDYVYRMHLATIVLVVSAFLAVLGGALRLVGMADGGL